MKMKKKKLRISETLFKKYLKIRTLEVPNLQLLVILGQVVSPGAVCSPHTNLFHQSRGKLLPAGGMHFSRFQALNSTHLLGKYQSRGNHYFHILPRTHSNPSPCFNSTFHRKHFYITYSCVLDLVYMSGLVGEIIRRLKMYRRPENAQRHIQGGGQWGL